MKRSSSRLVPGPVLHLALAAFMTLTASVAVAAPLDATRVTLANGLRVVLAPDMSALGVDAAL
jgi:hypothetical protein